MNRLGRVKNFLVQPSSLLETLRDYHYDVPIPDDACIAGASYDERGYIALKVWSDSFPETGFGRPIPTDVYAHKSVEDVRLPSKEGDATAMFEPGNVTITLTQDEVSRGLSGQTLDSVVPEQIAKVLDHALHCDATAISAMALHRFPCNKALLDHPTIVCDNTDEEGMTVGFIGLLNGLIAPTGRVIGYAIDEVNPGLVDAFYACPKPPRNDE